MSSVLELIGNTPMVRLGRVASDVDANVYAKCEFLNPSGSIKDRMALRMVQEAERKEELRKGGTIVDATSGNTGPALSFVGSMKGYKVKITHPIQMGGRIQPRKQNQNNEVFWSRG